MMPATYGPGPNGPIIIATSGGGATAWNPSDKNASITLTNSNRTATANTGAVGSVRSVASAASNQKVYFENDITLRLTSFFSLGFSTSGTVLSGFEPGRPSTSTALYFNNNGKFRCADSAGELIDTISSFTTGDRVDIAFDSAAGLVWARRTRSGTTLGWNDLLGGTQDPATAQGGVPVPFAGPYFAIFSGDFDNTANITTTFASTAWAGTAPSGFTQLA